MPVDVVLIAYGCGLGFSAGSFFDGERGEKDDTGGGVGSVRVVVVLVLVAILELESSVSDLPCSSRRRSGTLWPTMSTSSAAEARCTYRIPVRGEQDGERGC